MYLITGGAGFIGSNIVALLDQNNDGIVICDRLGVDGRKWRNIAKRRLSDFVFPEDVIHYLESNGDRIHGVVHMGAVTSTVAADVDDLVRNNFKLTMKLWNLCARKRIPFVYASSASTYGDGSQGFIDGSDEEYLSHLLPLNPYGWTKHLFDRWAVRAANSGDPAPPRWIGLKFFNVYGPNEYHKGKQQSIAAKMHAQIRERGCVTLFRSENPAYRDGEQLRDFVWVDDCALAALWALKSSSAASGLYNLGSGVARSFLDHAKIMFALMGVDPQIDFIELPKALTGRYQYFTCAQMDNLYRQGFHQPVTSLEEGLKNYVNTYLEADDPFR